MVLMRKVVCLQCFSTSGELGGGDGATVRKEVGRLAEEIIKSKMVVAIGVVFRLAASHRDVTLRWELGSPWDKMRIESEVLERLRKAGLEVESVEK